MPNAKDIQVRERPWTILLYGPQGVGKTWFAGTMPGPIFVLDWDDGIVTLRGREDVDYIQVGIDDWDAFHRFWEAFHVGKKAAYKGETFEPGRYRTLVVDSLTTMIDTALNVIATKVHMRDRVVVGKYRAAHRADYNVLTHVLGDFVREAKAMGINLLMTAHERMERDDMSGEVLRVGPSLSPSAANVVATLCDEIWRLDTRRAKGGGVERVLVTGAEGRFYGKGRIGGGRVFAGSPTFDEVLKAIEEGGT